MAAVCPHAENFMDFDLSLMLEAMPSLLDGAKTTAALALACIVCSLVLGIAGGVARAAGGWPNRILAVYVTTMRGIPLLVTLLFFYYGLPAVGLVLDAITVAVLAMSLTNAAYVTEIVRAGIQSVDPGQRRAARALGMSSAQAMRRIVLPQALRNVLPPLTNESITMLKNTSLVSVIAVPDLLRAGMDFMTWRANTFSPFAGVALVYLSMALPLIALNKYLEKRWTKL
jgi:His/Glu/Gln/Arg/opine family amino acid ABC transporter permease subunit